MPTTAHSEKLDSQNTSGRKNSGSEMAQTHPATVAVRVSSIWRAICMISQMVTRLIRMFDQMMTMAEAKVSLPKRRKIPAMRVGYPGAMNAVGPVENPK